MAIALLAPLCKDDFDAEGARAQVDAFISSGATVRGKVRYLVTSKSHDGEFGPPPIQIDAYFSGTPSRYRFDVTAFDDEQEATLSYFVLDDLTWVCSADGAAITSSATGAVCANEGLEDGASIGFLVFAPPMFPPQSLPTEEDEGIDFLLTGTHLRTIAGQFTHCYDARTTIKQFGESHETHSSTCFAPDGKVLLLIAERDDRRDRWEATALSDVVDTDFQLPYPVFIAQE